ncbi:DUF427 domain-containing protein [Mesobaculum littorinae]|uniref:DUF427 domain-containing protein n=1 Tax=Mesobaculum littorinae TaxID=2486419 RepID=A0A438AIY3_9RHOB|nr:DUF427 domain-containing protein [Mesobaculum littorinae]RVV98629.1 DUF427 domain-containing protein [Mesobaculum littorinae]
MSDKITISPASGTWVVRAGGAVIGETTTALRLEETGHDPVIYFPRADIAMALLESSDTVTRCPLKGEARHYSIQGKSGAIQDAAWSYESPIEGAQDITGHIAFYADKATVEEI